MESEGVLLPLFHEHLMMPCNDLRKGDCCGSLEAITDGYYCKSCDFFIHKKCSESPEYIQHSSHSDHTLKLQSGSNNCCDVCGCPVNFFYRCEICNFDIDLRCVKYTPPDIIEVSETHHHKLTLIKKRMVIHCDANCGKIYSAFTYSRHGRNPGLFHVNCVLAVNHLLEANHPSEVNHSYHSLHPLKLFKGQPPDYSDGKCRLCERKIDDILFYHCSSCNFSIDLRCVLNPPIKSFLDLKTHDHQLTLLPRLDSFTCNACGLKGDRSPYVCFHCGFMIHQGCIGLPRVININRHDHRISRTSVLGVLNSVCGVCRHKVDWTYGGYSCQKCPNYVVHSKCATRKDVWNGKELEGVPEEEEDIHPYVVIDENTIQHFSHIEHYLRLNVNGLYDNNKRCSACSHPVCLQSFYNCMDCDFILHQNCAEFPKKKWHVLHNERLSLVASVAESFQCFACRRMSNGFRYKHEDTIIDLRCSSISEPFVHQSHPHHPLYFIPGKQMKICNGCNEMDMCVLRCIEDGCEFLLDFKCATLPQVVKHRVDDHPLSLCYGEKASSKYWCDICEKETNPKRWFYTCKDHRASLHTECVIGDFAGLMPGNTLLFWGKSYEVVLNNSISRPFCSLCKSHCIPPIILKMLGIPDSYLCSTYCIFSH